MAADLDPALVAVVEQYESRIQHFERRAFRATTAKARMAEQDLVEWIKRARNNEVRDPLPRDLKSGRKS